MITTITLTKKKAEELKEIFPDRKVPVSSDTLAMEEGISCFRLDLSALTQKQRRQLVALARTKAAIPEEVSAQQILEQARIKFEDTCCPECSREPGEVCGAYDPEHTCPYHVPSEMEMEAADEEWAEDDEDFFDDEDEVELFDSGFMGSQLEAQLTQPTADNQCRQCRKFDEKLRGVPMQDKFCSADCKTNWENLANLRIAVGKKDMEARGYD